jgi:glycosyltransferase involved in cell wall biosynthesis
MTIPVILEMSPIAFGMESDLANTGITRVCRELLIALDGVLANGMSAAGQYYIFSSSSRWHNQLLAHNVLHHLKLTSFKPLMDPCDITLASCIDAHSGLSLKGLSQIAEPWISKLGRFGPTAHKYLSTNEYIYLTSYLPCPDYVRTNPNAKIVHHVHDLFPLTKPSLFHGGIDELWKRKAADFMPQDNYICISEATADDLRRVFPFIPTDHISVISNAGDHAMRIANTEPSDAVDRHGLESCPFFITVSTLEPRKNLPFLLRAFREYKDLYQSSHHLVCIGATGWMDDAERSFIDSMSSSGDIHFLGRLSDQDTFGWIQQATAYVSAARCEGFGLGLAEAMSLGCLPIAAANTSQIEVVEGIGCLFKTMQQLVDALASAAGCSYSKIDIQQKALSRFSWIRSAGELHGQLDSLSHRNY